MKQEKGFVKAFAVVFAAVMTLGMAACGGSQSPGETAAPETEAASESAAASEEEADTTIQVFIAASLSNVMEDVKDKFQETHPNVEIIYTADSSGTLVCNR